MCPDNQTHNKALLARMDSCKKTASWAVWKKPQEGNFKTWDDLSFPIDAVRTGTLKLRNDVVILGFNMSNGDNSDANDWGNFHATGPYKDHCVAEAFSNSDYQGAYMSDSIEFFTSDIAEARKEFKNNPTKYFSELHEELQQLGAYYPFIVCFGNDTKWILDELVKSRKEYHPWQVVRVPHYSGSASGAQAATAKKLGVDPNLKEPYRSITYREIVRQLLKGPYENWKIERSKLLH
jgi:hypothetical protein